MAKSLKKGKNMKEMIFGTRNETLVLYSRIFGHKKTNEVLEKILSQNKVISKINEAKMNGFNVAFDNDEVILEKDIDGINFKEYWKRYSETVRKKLLKLYDEETTDAIWTYYNTLSSFPLTSEEVTNSNITYYSPLLAEKEDNYVVSVLEVIGENIGRNGVSVMFPIKTFLDIFSNIKREYDNKIIEYKTDGEVILSVFIESLIEVFK